MHAHRFVLAGFMTPSLYRVRTSAHDKRIPGSVFGDGDCPNGEAMPAPPPFHLPDDMVGRSGDTLSIARIENREENSVLVVGKDIAAVGPLESRPQRRRQAPA
jgi:hypothetical protein